MDFDNDHLSDLDIQREISRLSALVRANGAAPAPSRRGPPPSSSYQYRPNTPSTASRVWKNAATLPPQPPVAARPPTPTQFSSTTRYTATAGPKSKKYVRPDYHPQPPPSEPPKPTPPSLSEPTNKFVYVGPHASKPPPEPNVATPSKLKFRRLPATVKKFNTHFSKINTFARQLQAPSPRRTFSSVAVALAAKKQPQGFLQRQLAARNLVSVNGTLYQASKYALTRKDPSAKPTTPAAPIGPPPKAPGQPSKFKFTNPALRKKYTTPALAALLRYRRKGLETVLKATADQAGLPTAPSESKAASSLIGGVTRLSIGGQQYTVKSDGKKLVRVATPLKKSVASRRFVAQHVQAMMDRKRRLRKQKRLCTFFTRFGHCDNGDKCRFIHDPSKVAICRRFLQESCTDPQCKLSHKVNPAQMPVCEFFLRGYCNKTNCAYAHVKVSPKAKVCKDFVNGWCDKGLECKELHTYECQAWKNTGSCPDGDNCYMHHRKKKERKEPKEPKSKRRARAEITPKSDDSEHSEDPDDVDEESKAKRLKTSDSAEDEMEAVNPEAEPAD